MDRKQAIIFSMILAGVAALGLSLKYEGRLLPKESVETEELIA